MKSWRRRQLDSLFWIILLLVVAGLVRWCT